MAAKETYPSKLYYSISEVAEIAGVVLAGLLLWRSLCQWLGGMGIIVLGIAILPKLAVGGMQLLGAEAPGPVAHDRLSEPASCCHSEPAFE